MFVDGLQYTRKWLLQHLMNARNDDVIVSEDKIAIHNLTACILEEAYLELLEWDDLNPYPEVPQVALTLEYLSVSAECNIWTEEDTKLQNKKYNWQYHVSSYLSIVLILYRLMNESL